MPFRSSSIQDRIMDTEPRPTLFPFTRASTSRLPPSSAPERLPPTHAPETNPPHKTKWSQHWLSATYPSVWTNASKERKDSDPTNLDSDEGLLSHVIEEENNDRWGSGPDENERERRAGERKVRIRQMLEIGALFGIGAILVGLHSSKVSFEYLLLPTSPRRTFRSWRSLKALKKASSSRIVAVASFRGSAEHVEGAPSDRQACPAAYHMAQCAFKDSTVHINQDVYVLIGGLAWHTDEKALDDREEETATSIATSKYLLREFPPRTRCGLSITTSLFNPLSLPYQIPPTAEQT
ncbi:uncharacterized protein PAC_03992 [Phialocephala subalpina]|uniref:Rhodanese domain-containing protein n=1 Tax=Phialocephala subalpina TaxID=576137 RepID=A0A1L7WMW5_9HELO|nr:uncharacterized protein PAC_03992 [Phialocephala subalpina]